MSASSVTSARQIRARAVRWATVEASDRSVRFPDAATMVAWKAQILGHELFGFPQVPHPLQLLGQPPRHRLVDPGRGERGGTRFA